MKICNKCGAQNTDQAVLCANCGNQLATQQTVQPQYQQYNQPMGATIPQYQYPTKTKKCKYCKTEIDAKAKICPNCRRTIKGHGCLIAFLVIAIPLIILTGSVVFIFSTANESIQKEVSGVTDENVSVVFDCSKFSRISSEELKSELGEPKSVENWTNKTSKGDFQMQIYTYDVNDFYGEFITYKDTVVKIHLFSNSGWTVEGSNSDNIFTMFGITPNENAKKTVDTGVTKKFSPVSDKVAEVEFYNYNEENKTFDIVYITYDLNYFD